MPEGPFVALLFDLGAGEYDWVSRPAKVEERQTKFISVPESSNGTDLFVTLVRSEPISDYEHLEVNLLAGTPGNERPPDVIVPGVYHFYALWYGLESPFARLTADTETSYLGPVDISLRAGKVESFVGELKPLPEVEAILDLPPEMPAVPLALEVLRQKDLDLLRRIDLPAGTRRQVIANLPAEPLIVVLQSPPWTLSQPVDLTGGITGNIIFAPHPIYLEGTVFHGDQPHPATVIFGTNHAQDELRVGADLKGHYETVLFRPGVYVIRVELEGRGGPGFVEMTDQEPITESRVLDFVVPANHFEVEVTDARSGEAITGAEITCHNRPDEGTTVALSTRTADDGVAVLPPLRPGRLGLVIRADGYLTQQIGAGRVETDDPGQRVEVALDPMGSSRELHLRLADGRPAAHAELQRRNPTPGGSIWRATADAAGRIQVPDAIQGSALLVRQPEAAFLIRLWQPGADEQIYWQLPRAQPPLRIRVVGLAGDPAAFARVALKIYGRWLTGAEGSWLTRSRATATRDGQWTAHHLPEMPLEIVAWERGSTPGDLLAYDPISTQVPWPRSGDPIVIEALR